MLCQQSNIPVSRLMLQEEALQTQLQRLGLQGGGERCNISEMKVAEGEGDVSQKTLSSWDERLRELIVGCEPRNV